MDFLKTILGEELYQQVSDKIAIYNGTPENEGKQIKLANLGDGAYVSKEKYNSLDATYNSKLAELTQANALIADLQKAVKGDETVQTKIQNYEVQVQQLQADLEKSKLESAIKVALLEAKATDVDYLTFKLEQDKSEFSLDENGKVKGLDEKIEGLKIKFPTQFATNSTRQVEANPLPRSDEQNKGLTKAELLKKSYAERVQFATENPEAYAEIMNK